MMTSLTVQICLFMVMFTGKGYNTLVLISTSMILVPYFLVAAFLVKLSFRIKTSLSVKSIGTGACLYGLWLIYAAGLDTLLLSAILYVPGLILFFYTQKSQHPETVKT